MKKIIVLILFIFLIAGCEKQEILEQEIIIEETESSVIVTRPVEKVIEEKAEEAIAAPQTLSRELRELIAKSEKINSLEYSYSSFYPDKAGYFAKFYVKDNKIKQEFTTVRGFQEYSEDFNAVYIDTNEKTIKAYCEDQRRCDVEEPNIKLDYEKYHRETPFDIIKSLKTGEIIGSEMYDRKNSVIVETENMKIWIWDYRGIPLKIERYENDVLKERVEFKSLTVNSVRESDVNR